MGDTQENAEIDGEVLGIEAFISRPENYGFAEQLFNDVEKFLYHAIDFGAQIENKYKYELGRYVGKAQVLFALTKDIIKSSNGDKLVLEIGRLAFTVIDNLAMIYAFIVGNNDLSKFDNLFKIFKENVEKMDEFIYKSVTV